MAHDLHIAIGFTMAIGTVYFFLSDLELCKHTTKNDRNIPVVPLTFNLIISNIWLYLFLAFILNYVSCPDECESILSLPPLLLRG